MKIKPIWTLIIFAMMVTGCLQVDSKVNLNKDGSGTIEETVLMRTAIIQMFKEFAVMFDSTKNDDFQMFNEDELKSKAINYGEGVKYVSGEKYFTEGFEGYKVVYAFKDINKIKISTSPDDKIPFEEGMEGENTEEKTIDDNLKFNFKKGSSSTLVIDFPKPQADENAKIESETVEDTAFTQESFDQISEMFNGLKFNLRINFNDDIDETDASFVEGNEVTILQVDFGEILKHKDIVEKLQKQKPETMDQFKDAIGDMKGIKIEFKDRIKVAF